MARMPTGPKRKPAIQLRVEEQFYEIEITDWSWPYPFGLNFKPDEPYREHKTVNLWGRLIAPKRVKAKTVRLLLLPNPGINEKDRSRPSPKPLAAF